MVCMVVFLARMVLARMVLVGIVLVRMVLVLVCIVVFVVPFFFGFFYWQNYKKIIKIKLQKIFLLHTKNIYTDSAAGHL